MFTGFNLSLGSDDLQAVARGVGSRAPTAPADQRQRIADSLDNLMDADGTLNVARMTADWFPDLECDLFLSHAHADAELAGRFAGFLGDRFGVRTFVDGDLWHSIGDLQTRIDDRARKPGEALDVDSVRRTTAHVHMMLMSSLAKMMDRCECLMFLNTPNSVSAAKSTQAGGIASSTYSPWIYGEISLSTLLRRRPPDEHRPAQRAIREIRKEPSFRYDLPLQQLRAIGVEDLRRWATEFEGGTRAAALDWLYRAYVPDQLKPSAL